MCLWKSALMVNYIWRFLFTLVQYNASAGFSFSAGNRRFLPLVNIFFDRPCFFFLFSLTNSIWQGEPWSACIYSRLTLWLQAQSILTNCNLKWSFWFIHTDWNGWTHPQFNECHPNDTQHLSVLQHFRENDISVCQSHKPDDNDV